GLRVVRLEVLVGDGPLPDRAGDPLAVGPPRLEVLLARPEQGPAIKTRPPSEDPAHVEPPGPAVDVHLPIVVRPLVDQHRLLVLGGAAGRVPTTPLEQQDRLPRARAGSGEGRAPRPTADDDHVEVVQHSRLPTTAP